MTDLINAFKDIGGHWTIPEVTEGGHRLVQNHETDHIVLAPNCTYNFARSFDGGSALPPIGGGYFADASVTVTLDGNGSTFVRTGSDRYRFLAVQDTGAELVVNNLTLTGGAAPNGAGIHADPFLAKLCGPLGGLHGCSDAAADDGGDGGAIANVGVLRLSGVTFNNNSAGDGHQARSNVPYKTGGFGGSGGAVYSSPQSWLFVDGSAFSGNRAGAGGTGATMGGLFEVGGQGGDGGTGGAIGSFGYLQVTNSTFRSNLSGGPGAPGKGILGLTTAGASGGAYGSGAAVGVGSGSRDSSIASSTFVDNGNRGGYGGAISDYATLTVTNSTFQHNGASWGGAIWNSNGNVNVRNSDFVGNYSDNDGDVVSVPFTGKVDIANSVIVAPTTGAHTACNNTSGFGSETNQSLSQIYSLHAVWGNYSDAGGGGCSDHVHTAANAKMVLGLPSSPALNGGSTLSFAPAAESSLINFGDPAYCPAYDQRGMPRYTGDGGCDIGSVDHFTATARTLTGPVFDPAYFAVEGGYPNGYRGITQNYPWKFYFSAPVITDPAQHYKLRVFVNDVERDYETDKNGNKLRDLSLLPLTFADAGAATAELWVGAVGEWIKVATGTPFRVLLENNTAPTLSVAMDGGTSEPELRSTNVDEFTTHHFVVTVTDPDPGATWSFSKAPTCGANATLSGLTTAAHSFAFDCTVGAGASGLRTELSATVVDDQFVTNAYSGLRYLNIVDQQTRFGMFTGPDMIPINTTAHYTFTIIDGHQDLVALAANPTWTIKCGRHLSGPTNTQTTVDGTVLTTSFDCTSDGTGLGSFNTSFYTSGTLYNNATTVVFDPEGSGASGIYETNTVSFTIISRVSASISQQYDVGTSNPEAAQRVLLGEINYPAAGDIAHTRINWGDGTVDTYAGWIGTSSGSRATFTHPYTSPGKHTVTVEVDLNGALGTWVTIVSADTWDYDSAMPVLSLPDPIALTNAVPGESNRVHFAATATDPINGTYAAGCSVADGAAMPVGVTRVSCSVNRTGTTVSGSFEVRVLDVQPPVIGTPTITQQKQDDGVHVHLAVPFSDDAPSSGQAVCDPASGSVFAQGTTLVTCAATDAAGNVTKTSFAVGVADGTGPVVNAPSSVVDASPDGAGVAVTFHVTATDVTGAPLTPVCVPASGSTFAPGTTTVECSATDAGGNVTVAHFPVVVSGGTVSGMNDLAQQFQYGGGIVQGRRIVTVKLAADLSAITDDEGTGTQLQLQPGDDATLDLNGHDLTIDAPYGLPAIGVPDTASLRLIDSAGGGKLTMSAHAGAAAIGGGICQSAGNVSIDGVSGTAVSYTDGVMTGATGIGSGAKPDAATIANWGAANVPGDCNSTLRGGTVTFTGTAYDGAPTTVVAPSSAVGADIAWRAPTGGAPSIRLTTIRVAGESHGVAFSPGGLLSVDLQGGTTTDTSPGGPLGDPDHLQLSEPTKSGYLFGGWRKGSPTGPAWSYQPATAASDPESQTSFTVYASWIELRSGTSCAALNESVNSCQLVLRPGDDAVFDLRGHSWTAGDGTGTSPGIELPAGAKLTIVDSIGNGQVTATGGDGAAGIGGASGLAAGALVVQSGDVIATGTGGAGVGGGVGANGGTVDVSGGYFSASSQAWSAGGYGAGVGAGDGGSAGGAVTVHGTRFTGTTSGFPTNGAPGSRAPAATYSFVSGAKQFEGGSGEDAGLCNVRSCNGFWVQLGYAVTFHLNGGDAGGSLAEGDTIMFDPGLAVLGFLSPTRDGSGSDFAGWYLDAGLSQPVDESTRLTGPANLYAKYGDTALPALTVDTEPDLDTAQRQYFATPVRVTPPSGFSVPESDVTVHYQWSRCTAQEPIGCTPIAGAADQPTYTPRLADLGRGLQVTVTALAEGSAPYTWTKRTSVVLPARFLPGERHATNFDSPYVGQTASFTFDWNFQPQRVDYVWGRDGVPITGAPNSSEYVVQPADVGAHLSVMITARGDGFMPYTITMTTGSTVINNNFTTAPTPTIAITPPTGSTDTTHALIGSRLTADPGTWEPTAQFSYQWYIASGLEETAIPDATDRSYQIPSGSGNKDFYVAVTGSDAGFNSRTVRSAQLRVPVLDVHAQIGINTSSGAGCRTTVSSSAKLAFGEVVCGLVPDLPAGASVHPDQFHAYQWYRDGVPVPNLLDGTNSYRYSVVADDVSHRLTVGITVTAPGYDPVTVMSPSSALATVHPVANVEEPVLSGTPAVGQTLRVTDGTWSFPASSTTYSWSRDSQQIAGATGTSYVLQPADAGHSIRAFVTWRGTGTGADSFLSTTADASSNLLGPVPFLVQTATPVPTITGSGEVGTSLTAVPGTWDSGVTFGYAWQLDDGSPVGTDSAHLALTPEMLGHTITVSVTGRNLGYADVTRDSTSGVLVTRPSDTTAPVVSVPADKTVEATSSDGATVSFVATATDAVDGSTPVTCAPVSGSTFPVGTTTVTCSSTDEADNQSQKSFTVTVVDTTAPAVDAPADKVVEATSSDGATVSFVATATDKVDGSTPVTCAPASGSTFPIGTTTVTCSSTDESDNESQKSFTVTVVDTTAPVVSVPADKTVEATAANGATVSFTSTATDAVDGTTPVTCAPVSGSTFPVGTTTVTCSSTDEADNQSAKSFTVTVVDTTVPDTTAPVVNVPADKTVEATAANGATVNFTSTATDAVDGPTPVTCAPASGSTFAIGTTTVTCSSTDEADNESQKSFTVTVVDTTAPVVSVPADKTVEATAANGATVNFTSTATDAVDGTTPDTCAPVSGSTFAIGTTTVTCSSTDESDNESQKSFTVTVVDTTAPVVSVPADKTVEATAANGATVSFTSTATDAVDGSTPVTCAPGSGSTFAIGTTTVTCSSTDEADNTGQQSFTITVVDTTVPDTTAPVVNVPADKTVEATSSDGAAVSFAATATDAVDGSTPVTCAPASGSTFPIGTTTVTCSSTDEADNESQKSFTVTVVDTTAPVVSVPADKTVEATSSDGAAVSFTSTATDAVDGSTPVTCAPASGSTFPIGTTTVTCSSTDEADNESQKSFTVTVVDTTVPDTTAPVVNVPADKTVEATSSDGATVSFTATATDTVDGTTPVTCAPASGSTFPIGTTTVTCSSTDQADNESQKSFTVAVVDTTAPAVDAPADKTVEATGANGATVSFTSTATDAVDGSTPVTCAPGSGSRFPVGTTTVTCSSTDEADNESQKSFTVTVVDTTAPVVSVPADKTVETTAANGATVSFTSTATDAVDGSTPVSCTPGSGSRFPIGTTTVTCSSTDQADNTGQQSFTITVVDTTVPDTTAPVVNVPADKTVEATSSDGATVSFAATATDAVDGSTPVTCAPGSGSTFPIGTTTVTCSSTDQADNESQQSFTVTVVDTTAPQTGLSGSLPANPTNKTSAGFAFGGTDAVGATGFECRIDGGAFAPCASPTSYSGLREGTHSFQVRARDAAGNIDRTPASSTWTVDTTAPVVKVPADRIVNATTPDGATVTYALPKAADSGPGAPVVSCRPTSGTILGLGTTAVRCSATDAAGNDRTVSFTVRVKGAGAQLADLRGDVQRLPARLDTTTRTELVALLRHARAATARDLEANACGTMTSFVDAVKAQSGRKIATGAAHDLLMDARRITRVIGCPYPAVRIRPSVTDGAGLAARLVALELVLEWLRRHDG